MANRIRRASPLILVLLFLMVSLVIGAPPQGPVYAATFTVNNLSDSVDANPGDGICATGGDVCTLRAAIMEANAFPGDDIIILDAETYLLDVDSGNEDDSAAANDLDILSGGGAITIVGSSTGTTIVDAQGNFRIFEVNGGNLELRNLVLQNGDATAYATDEDGGAIRNDVGTVVLDNVIIRGNTAANGGAIFNRFGQVQVLNDTEIGQSGLPNTATTDGGGIYSIYSTGLGSNIVTINRSTVQFNVATNGDGGGIYATDDGSLMITNSTIQNNDAGNSGGGVFVVNPTTPTALSLTIMNSQILANNAGSSGGFSASGLHIEDVASTTIDASTIADNTADDGAGIVFLSASAASTANVLDLTNSTVDNNDSTNGGGGIANIVVGTDRGATVNITNTVVSNNDGAVFGGVRNSGAGAILNVELSTIEGNSSGASGGGIENIDGETTVTFSTIDGNTADVAGAGIYNEGTLTVVRSTISNNDNTAGGAAGGGGIANLAGGQTLIDTSTISSNDSNGAGGGVHNSGVNSITTIESATIFNNSATTGGGIFNADTTTTFENTLLAGNGATTGPDCNVASGQLSSGGFNLVEDSTGCTITNISTDDQIDPTDPILIDVTLANNGGPTFTHRLLDGSIAVDQGNCAETTDQRGDGFTRPRDLVGFVNQANGCDIGAFEVQSFQQAILGDLVFNDLNANGIQDPGEPGIDGVTVTLFDQNDVQIAQTTTANGGIYRFDAPVVGGSQDFTLEIDPADPALPVGAEFTQPNQGGNDNLDSDFDDVTGAVLVTVAGGDTRLDLDAGFVVPASIGDFVFLDDNGNGSQDVSELGIAGIEVQLRRASDDSVVATTATLADDEDTPGIDEAGQYIFEDVVPGEYYLRFVIPGSAEFLGLEFTIDNVGGDDNIDSDADPISGETEVFTLQAGISQLNQDAGLYEQGTYSGFAFNDADGDGIYQIGTENPVIGYQVTIVNSTTGNAVTLVATDANGLFSVSLPPGTYEADFSTIPAPFDAFTVQDAGADDVDSDANPTTGVTTPVLLTSGGTVENVSAGVFQSAQLGGLVWNDANANGLFDSGETAYANENVTLTLLDENENIVSGVSPQTTAIDGTYSFSNLAPSTYIVRISIPSGFALSQQNFDNPAREADDSDFSQGTRLTDVITLTGGQNRDDIDAGLNQTATIAGTVWNDDSVNPINGRQENVGDLGGETPASGVEVNVYAADGVTLIDSTTTDASGNYTISGLPGGSVVVEFVPALGRGFTLRDQGNNSIDSDVDQFTGRTEENLTIDATTDIDAGLINAVTIGDRVFDDRNTNGIQDGGEPGLGGITVRLFLVTDVSTILQTETVTTPNGNYSFLVEQGNDYLLEFDAPANFVFTIPNAPLGDDATDSNAVPTDGDPSIGQATVTAEASDNTIDAGLYALNVVEGMIFNDADQSGQRDIGELPATGVTVNLLDSTGAQLDPPQSDSSDGSGMFSFVGIPTGSYILEVLPPANTGFTLQDFGADDARDSDVNEFTGRVAFTVTSAETATFDAGLIPAQSISGTIFRDLNGDGLNLADPDDPGIQGITVNLYRQLGGETLVASTITDSNGNYSFTVQPGQYIIEVIRPNGFISVPQNVNANADDAIDSDISEVIPPATAARVSFLVESADVVFDGGFEPLAAIGGLFFIDLDSDALFTQDVDNIVADATISLYTDPGTGIPDAPAIATTTTSGTIDISTNSNYVFTDLEAGDYIVEFTLPSGFTYVTPNAGNDALDSDAIPDGDDALIGRVQVTLAAGEQAFTISAGFFQGGSIGDLVFNDLNGNGLQDGGEPGVGDVTINLLDGSGTPLSPPRTTTSDTNTGAYIFDGVEPGTYIVEFVEPADAQFTTANVGAGANEATDSDADETTGQTEVVTVTSGSTITNVDAGLIVEASIEGLFFNDVNGDGIQNGSEDGAGLNGATVTLFDENNTQIGSPVTISSASDPNFEFTSLDPGNYYLTATVPSGFAFSPQDAGDDDTLDSDLNPISFTTPNFAVASGQAVTNVDIGAFLATTIGGRVFFDADNDSIRDPGELGRNGVTVELYRQGTPPTLISTITTQNIGFDGAYQFNVVNGSYQIRVIPEAGLGFVFSTPNQGVDDTADSDVDASGIVNFTVPPSGGFNITSIDAGLQQSTIPLEITKYAVLSGGSPAGPGDTLTWVVCARNVSLRTVDGVTISDTINRETQTVNTSQVFYGLGGGTACPVSGIPTGAQFPGRTAVPTNNIVDNDGNPPTTVITTPANITLAPDQFMLLTIQVTLNNPAEQTSVPATDSGVLAMSTLFLVLGWFGRRLLKSWRAITAVALIAVFMLVAPTFGALNAQQGDDSSPTAAQTDEEDGRWVRYDSDHPTLQQLGNWEIVPDSRAVGGSYLRSTDGDAALVLDVSGTRVRIAYPKAWNTAQVSVVEGTQQIGLVSDYSADEIDFVVSNPFSFSANTQHVLRLQGNGTAANPSASSATLMIDAIDVWIPNEANNDDVSSLTGIVWSDSNGNGVFDTSDRLVENVEVNLFLDFGTNDTLIDTDITDSDGRYVFTNLPTDDYWIVIQRDSLPDDLDPTSVDWSPVEIPTPFEGNVVIPPAATVEANTVTGTAWLDADESQSVSNGDTRLADVTVTLYQDNGDESFNPGPSGDFVVQRATSNEEGTFDLSGLLPGIYWIDLDTTDLPANVDQDQIWQIMWVRIPDISTVNLLLLPEGDNLSLDGIAVADTNRNDAADEDDTPLEGLTLYLYADDGDDFFSDNLDTLMGEVVADANGAFTFDGLSEGIHWLVPNMQNLPDAALQTQYWAPMWLRLPEIRSAEVVLIPAPDASDITLNGNGLLVGTVFSDDNGNRRYDASNESGIRDALVELYNDSKVLISAAEVDENGMYRFENLPDGTYYVQLVESSLPEKFMNTVAYGGHGDQNPQSIEIVGTTDTDAFDLTVQGPNFAYALDTDGDGSPDGREGVGDRDNDNIPNYQDPFDPTGIVYAADAQGNTVALGGVEVHLVYQDGGEWVTADTIQPNPQRTNSLGAYRFDLNVLENGLPPDGSQRVFRLQVEGINDEAFTFPSESNVPGNMLVITGSNAQVAPSLDPAPDTPYYLAFQANAGDADLSNNLLGAQAQGTFESDVTNTGCAIFTNGIEECATAEIDFEVDVEFNLTPLTDSATVFPGDTDVTFTHTLSNDGPLPDRYRIELTSDESYTQELTIRTPGGVVLATIGRGGSFDTDVLDPGNTLELELVIDVPTTGLSNGEINNYTITATSLSAEELGATLSESAVDSLTVEAGCVIGNVFRDDDEDGFADGDEGVANAELSFFRVDGNDVTELARNVLTDDSGRGAYQVSVPIDGSSDTVRVELNRSSLPSGATLISPTSNDQEVRVELTDEDCARADFIISVREITITKTINGSQTVNPGDQVFFTIVITNGPNSSPVSGVFADTVPTAAFDSTSITSSATNLSGNTTADLQSAGGSLVGYAVTLDTNSSLQINIQATVRTDLTALPVTVENVASLNIQTGETTTIQSNRVTVTVQATDPDTDDDGVPDSVDADPNDPTVTTTTDGGGTGTTDFGQGGADTATGTGDANVDPADPGELPQTGYMPIEYFLNSQDGTSDESYETTQLSTAGRIVIGIGGLLVLAMAFMAYRFYNQSESLYEWLQNRAPWISFAILALIGIMFLGGAASVLYTVNDITGVVDTDNLLGVNDDAGEPVAQSDDVIRDGNGAIDGDSNGDGIPDRLDVDTANETNGITWLGEDGTGAAQQLPTIGDDTQRFIIPSLNVYTRLVNAPRVGTTWSVDDFFNEVARLEGTAVPGMEGNLVIAGHVTHTRGIGPFNSLDRITLGDNVIVKDYDIEYTYYVTDIMEVGANEVWVTDESDDALLTLITCSGWDPATRTYDTRLVVRARLDKWRIVDGAADAIELGERTRYEVGQAEEVELAGEWAEFGSYNTSEGTYFYSEEKDASATFTFEGDKFRLSYVMFSNFGEFEVYLDGERLMTIDTYSPFSGFGSTNVIQTTPGRHTLEIRNTDRANDESKGNVIALDAIDVWR